MQQSAVSSPGTEPGGLPHTHSGARHWLVTAVAIAAVAGAAALVQPADAGATAAEPAAGTGPDPLAAVYPLDCGPFEVLVTDQAELDLDADGRAETVAVVRCDAGSGTPPNGVYLLTHTDHGGDGPATPRVAATLVEPDEGMTVDDLRAEETGFTARLVGYSSVDVPRCCPDLLRDVAWQWQDGRLQLIPGRAPNSV
ncbi:hypothetical protein [Streptomyces profundus]|uniref:hypothetical protein n=1 Tax=Streptomyces profundus TaxID=2867410 RepID=UPI001D166AF1|nr:hypothetical protein [Streptomyces sp. MA3_2.13]